MNDTVREPVDNSHMDAGIAARDAQQEAKTEAVAEQAAEIVEDEQQAQNDPEESATLEQGTESKPKKRGVHNRIDELTKEKHDAKRAAEDAQRERDYWREMAQRHAPKDDPKPAQAATPDEGEPVPPTLMDCDFDDERYKQELAQYSRRWYQWQRTQEKKQEAEEARRQAFVTKEAAFRAQHPDYDAVVYNPNLPITKAVAEVLTETDDPPAVAYYLGQHPEEAAAIAQMTPHQIGRAIGRIEAKLSAPASDAPRQPEPKRVTSAPAPVTTLTGVPTHKKDYGEMSQAEYEETRRKEREAKGLPNR